MSFLSCGQLSQLSVMRNDDVVPTLTQHLFYVTWLLGHVQRGNLIYCTFKVMYYDFQEYLGLHLLRQPCYAFLMVSFLSMP